MRNLVNIDLFAGIGGFHLGWSRNGVETVWASEWDEKSGEVYQTNYGIMPAGDITQIRAQDVPPHDVLSAGFPCQAFSISGKKLGFADTRGTLFFDVARIVKHHTPKLVLLENVKHFTVHDGGKTLHTAVSVLESLGYKVLWKVLSAQNFGVPQTRERIYIAGFRGDVESSEFNWPTPKNEHMKVGDILGEENVNNEKLAISRSDIFMDWEKVEEYNSYYTSQFPVKPLRVGVVGKGGQGNRIYHYSGSAITLSSQGGGVGGRTGLYYTPSGVIRRLSVRESARLMGFPEDFILHPQHTQALKQLGNAVVVDVVQQIGQEMLKTLPLE